MPGSRRDLDVDLPAGDRVLLDTSVLIAYLDARETISPLAKHIIDDLVKSGRNNAIVSMVTVMELLTRPVRQGPSGPYQHIMQFLTRFPNLQPIDVDLPVAQEAAMLRYLYKFSGADALVIASGLIGQVNHLVTNDHSWSTKLQPIVQANRLKVCYVNDYLPFP